MYGDCYCVSLKNLYYWLDEVLHPNDQKKEHVSGHSYIVTQFPDPLKFVYTWDIYASKILYLLV